jgi:hypothetical protein
MNTLASGSFFAIVFMGWCLGIFTHKIWQAICLWWGDWKRGGEHDS